MKTKKECIFLTNLMMIQTMNLDRVKFNNQAIISKLKRRGFNHSLNSGN